MKCPECEKEGLKSQVYPGLSTITLLGWEPFYDENGQYHNHDPNFIRSEYACSNGHEWREQTLQTCPNCNYGKEGK